MSPTSSDQRWRRSHAAAMTSPRSADGKASVSYSRAAMRRRRISVSLMPSSLGPRLSGSQPRGRRGRSRRATRPASRSHGSLGGLLRIRRRCRAFPAKGCVAAWPAQRSRYPGAAGLNMDTAFSLCSPRLPATPAAVEGPMFSGAASSSGAPVVLAGRRARLRPFPGDRQAGRVRFPGEGRQPLCPPCPLPVPLTRTRPIGQLPESYRGYR